MRLEEHGDSLGLSRARWGCCKWRRERIWGEDHVHTREVVFGHHRTLAMRYIGEIRLWAGRHSTVNIGFWTKRGKTSECGVDVNEDVVLVGVRAHGLP